MSTTTATTTTKPSSGRGLVVLSENSDDDLRSTGGNTTTTPEEHEVLFRKETRAVFHLRLVFVFILIAVAVTICVVTYYETRNYEIKEFQTFFNDQATRVVNAFGISAQARVGAIEAFGTSVTSFAKSSNSTWPNVTLPDFQRRGSPVVTQAEVMSLVMVVLVTKEQRNGWEAYSVANQGWLAQGLAIEAAAAAAAATSSGRRLANNNILPNPLAIPDQIFRVQGLLPTIENGTGPYLPVWQFAPAIRAPNLVNFNLLSHPGKIPWERFCFFVCVCVCVFLQTKF